MTGVGDPSSAWEETEADVLWAPEARPADLAENEFAAQATAIPVFLAHGSLDPVVPQGLGLMSREWLTRHQFKVDWHSYPMPHSVSMDEIRHITQWLDARLAAAEQ